MTQLFKVIRSFITIFIFIVQLCLALEYFQECEPRKCGGLMITYPFYIQGLQKSYCGYPGFQVTCNPQDHMILNLSGNSFVIREIFYNNQSFHTINSVFLDTTFDCNPSSVHNVSLDDRFTFSFSHSDVVFLQNCSKETITSLVQYKEFVCHKDNKTRGIYAAYAQDINMEKFAGKCQKVVLVPYEGQKGSDVEAMLAKGLLLNWRASNCSECTNSGGRCSFNGTTLQTQCFCPHGVHSHSCPKNRLPLIFGLGIAGGAILLAAVVGIWCRKKVRLGGTRFVPRSTSLDRSGSDLEKGSIYFGVPLFSYSELQEATDNFNQSKELGDGGFGTVYYGKLKDGREVAVKRLYEKNYKRVEQFMNEVQILTRLRHQNLVSLYGCTSHHSKELLLVYEFVPNGTVADHLYGDKSKTEPLQWPVRLRIAIETASALCYLHASDIIHRDVKTHNILLDSSFNVKVADFGLSRLFPNHVSHVSTAPQGTPGYLDPEYHQCYQLTGKSDVYSFGVVLVELISSLPAVDMSRHRHEINLSNYAMTRIQRCAFDELVDPELGFKSDFKVRRMTTAVGELAFQCLQHDKEFRPAMDEVLEILKRIQSADYDALPAEEMTKNNTGLKSTNPPPSPIEDDHAKLLNNHPLHPSSPDSVMDKWASKSTTPSTSK